MGVINPPPVIFLFYQIFLFITQSVGHHGGKNFIIYAAHINENAADHDKVHKILYKIFQIL